MPMVHTQTDFVTSLVKQWRVRIFDFSNGLSVALQQETESPMSAFYLRVGAGSIHETEHWGSGLSHLLEHAMFLGCKAIPSKDGFSQLIEKFGGTDLNAYTTYDHTAYFATVFTAKLHQALKALYQFMLEPLFPQQALNEEMGTIRSEMQMTQDKASWMFHDYLQTLVYPKLPYALPIIGFKERFNRLTRKQLVTYHRKQYTPANMILTLKGELHPEQTITYLEKLFAARARERHEGITQLMPAKQQQAAPTTPPVVLRSQKKLPAPPAAADISLDVPPNAAPALVHPRARHVQLAYVWQTPSFAERDDVLINLLPSFLSDGDSTPLYQHLKERLGLVESLSAHTFIPVPYFKTGYGTFGIFVKLKAPANMQALQRQMKRVTTELFKCLHQLSTGSLGSKTPSALTKLLSGIRNETLKELIDEKEQLLEGAANLATSLHATGTSYYALTYLQKVQAVTLPQLLTALRQYLLEAPYTLVQLYPPATAALSKHCVQSPYSQTIKRARYPVPLLRRHQAAAATVSRSQAPPPPPAKLAAAAKQTNIANIANTVNTAKPPKLKKITLNNGAQFISETKTNLPKVALVLRFKGGQAFEGESAAAKRAAAEAGCAPIPYGAFTLFSKLIFSSNAQFSKQTLHALLKLHAIDYETSTSSASISFSLNYLKDKHDIVLKLLKSILLRGSCANFHARDFQLEKRDLEFQITRERESTSKLSQLAFNAAFYAHTPYAMPLRGSVENIGKLQQAQLEELYTRFWRGANLVVALKGDFSAAAAEAFKDCISSLARGNVVHYPRYRLFSIVKLSPEARQLQQHENTAQETYLRLAFRTPPLKHKATLALALIRSHLSGMGGPLFKLRSADFIKNGKSLGGRAYSLGCQTHAEKDFGAFIFYAALRKEARGETAFMRRAFIRELSRLKQRPLGSAALQAAKDAMRAHFMMQLRSLSFPAMLETLYVLYNMHHQQWQQRMEELKTISADELLETARQFFPQDGFLEHVLLGGESSST